MVRMVLRVLQASWGGGVRPGGGGVIIHPPFGLIHKASPLPCRSPRQRQLATRAPGHIMHLDPLGLSLLPFPRLHG